MLFVSILAEKEVDKFFLQPTDAELPYQYETKSKTSTEVSKS